MLRLSVFLVLALVAFADTTVDDKDVLVLDSETFDGAITDNERILVEFYAPWCGHCKRLAPEWAKAATALKDLVPLAKVDCTAEKDVCSKYEVQGYPTIKWFTGGEPSEYNAGRDAAGIEKFVKSRLRDAVTSLEDEDALKTFKADNKVAFILFGDDQGDFKKVAESLRDDFAFGLAPASLKTGEADGVLYRDFDEPEVEYTDGDYSKKAFMAWLKSESFPLVGEIGPDNYGKYMEKGLPLLWIALDPESSNDDLLEQARKAAKDFKDTASFVTLDGVKYASHIKNLGYSGELPGVVLTKDQQKFLLPEGDITTEALVSFMNDYKNGDLEEHLKSQDVPEKNDEPVRVIVGKTFEDEVVKSDKNVLVEFYAPWCGHCKKLEPEYTALGEEWAENDNVVIAKVDATENDAKGVSITGFPTIMLWKAGSPEPETYSGQRTQADLSKWIAEQTGESPAVGGAEDKDEL